MHLTLAQCERLVGDAAGARRRIERARDLLRAMPAAYSGRLTLHAADLDDPGCFDGIFAGCDGVAQ